MRQLDIAIMRELIALGVAPEHLPGIFAAFERRRGADAYARHYAKPDKPTRTRSVRGTRFAADAIPEPGRTSEAVALGLPADRVADAFAEFGAYWQTIPGPRGVRLDWPAVWANRVRFILTRGAIGGRLVGEPIARTYYQQRQQEAQRVREKLSEYIERNTAAPSGDASD